MMPMAKLIAYSMKKGKIKHLFNSHFNMSKEINVNNMKKIDRKKFQNNLLTWFDENKRHLPWRLTENPYYIWISEIMLQQTQVDTVIPYYENFISKFPTPYALAEAPQDDVYKAWEGLGYYSRARNLQQGVREVVEQYGGEVPDDKKSILNIKGIGPYTAGAILSIAYGKKEPAVDGNVMRVLSRVFLIDDDIMKAKTRKKFEEILYDLIPEQDPSSFNQGLMELGALICKPKSPKCSDCPVRECCHALDEGIQENYPVKKKKQAPKREDMAVLVIRNQNGEILIQKRPEQGLLASLWELPTIKINPEADPKKTCETYLKKEHNLDCSLEKLGLEFTHTFSHIKWYLTVYEGEWNNSETSDKEKKWVSLSDLTPYSFPIPHQKIIKNIQRKV